MSMRFTVLASLGLAVGAEQEAAALGAVATRSLAEGGYWPWWDTRGDYTRLELVLMIIFTITTLLFDWVFHVFRHMAEHSWSFQDDENEGVHQSPRGHKRLMQEFVKRVAEEFMTLGFVALCIFSFNNFKGDEMLEHFFPKPNHGMLPDLASTWLHMLEIVHIDIFLGMCLYFIIALQIARGGKNTLMKWRQAEKYRMEARSDMQKPEKTETCVAQHFSLAKAANQYMTMYDYFVKEVLLWKVKNPDHWAALLERLDIDSTSADAEEQVEKQLRRPFVFCKYTAHCIEDGICDCIEVASATRVGLLVALSILWVHVAFASSEVVMADPGVVLGGFGIAMLAGMEIMMRRNTALMAARVEDRLAPSNMGRRNRSGISIRTVAERIHSSWYTEIIFVRVLQFILVFVCYTLARYIVELLHDTDTLLSDSIDCAKGCVYLLLYLLLVVLVPCEVPCFLLHMSLPPYVDRQNLKTLLNVMRPEQHMKLTLAVEDQATPDVLP